MRNFLILLLVLVSTYAGAQNKLKDKKDDKLVQFSGIVLTSDSLQGIPFATVMVKGTGRGTISNYQGFFSLVCQKGDHVVFSTVGFKSREVVIPDTLSLDKYSIIALLTQDNINLDPVMIYPLPSREDFKNAFLSLHIPDDQLEIAKKNLEKEKLREIGQVMIMDGQENQAYNQKMEAYKFTYAGQVPPMNVFNPIAWAQFFQAWKHGDFKKKEGLKYDDNNTEAVDINNLNNK